MKNLKSTKIVLIVLLLILALTFTSKVLATGTSDNPLQINITTNPTTNTQTSTNTQTNITTNTVAPTTNTATSNYVNTNTNTLPQTGDASDYAIFLLIAVSAVIAIYAYKRIKDYNIK